MLAIFLARRFRLPTLCIAAWVALSLVGGAMAVAARPATEDFEDDDAQNWRATPGNEMIVTSERFKSGEKSLRWTWRKPGDALVCTWPKPLTGLTVKDKLGLWVYNEKPTPTVLRLELLSQRRVVGRCWYGLDFRSWRPLGAPYAEVLGDIKQPIDAVRLIAPKGGEIGRLYIDWVNARCTDPLFADDQQPWIGRPEILKAATPESFVYTNRDVARNRPWLPPRQKPNQKELDDLATIARRVPLPTVKASPDPTILADCENLLRLRRVDNRITGRPIVGRKKGFLAWGFNEPAGGLLMTDESSKETCRALLGRLASAYLSAKAKKQTSEAEKLLQPFFDLCDHLVDQGWVEGNNNVSDGLNVAAICALREELGRTGRLREMLVSAAVHGTLLSGVSTVEASQTTGGPGNGVLYLNCDMLFYSLGGIDSLALFAAIPDEEERLQRVRTWQRAMDLKCQPRFGEFLCLDGTVHHHSFFHPAYGLGGLRGTIHFGLAATHGTCFTLSPESIAALQRALKTYVYLSGDGILPGNVPGYTGSPMAVPSIAEYAGELAQWNPKNGQPFDREMASVFLAFTQGSKNAKHEALAAGFRAAGVEPWRYPGHLTLNGAAMAAHRRDDWLVVVGGIFKHRRGKEVNLAYTGTTNARYAKNGSIFVVSSGTPTSPWASGHRFDGWDGRFQPGATSLFNKPKAGFEGPGFLHSQSAFGGGTDIDGNGVWGMEFVPDDKSLEFRKSVFFFGNRVTVVTTDVRHGVGAKIDETQCPILTTLYQNAFGHGGSKDQTNRDVPPAEEPCWIDGREVRQFPHQESLDGSTAHWLIDNKRTGYFIHAGNPPLKVERRRQTWLYYLPEYVKNAAVKTPEAWAAWTKTPEYQDPANYTASEGNFAAAWFDHGAKPDEPACVYTLMPRATPEAMRTLAGTMAAGDAAPYAILQKDTAAHVLFDRESNTTGYVLFEAGEVSSPGPLRKVNRPCWAMLCQRDGRLRLSVASTDLERWRLEGFVAQGDIVLHLAGRWKIAKLAKDAPADCSASPVGDKTKVTIPYRDFMPVRILLEPAERSF